MRDGLEKIKDPVARKDESEKRLKAADRARARRIAPSMRCQVSQLLPRRHVPADRDARDQGRPPRLRAGALGRQLRRRDRQLGVAAPHRRLVVLSARTSARTASRPTPRPTTCRIKPKHWLKVTTAGLKPGDFVMVAGYPGSHEPHDDRVGDCTTTSSGTTRTSSRYLQGALRRSPRRTSPTAARPRSRPASLKQGMQNGLEKYQGIARRA